MAKPNAVRCIARYQTKLTPEVIKRNLEQQREQMLAAQQKAMVWLRSGGR